jgi:[acyl-carrier-protein] S-malonyltransferase
MNVFFFPGQGSQETGMAADLFKPRGCDAPSQNVSATPSSRESFVEMSATGASQLPAFHELVCRASERTGSDLEKICLRGPERELMRTKNLQPLLVCVSLGYLRHLTDKGIQPDKVLGHSLGEISALAAAGIVNFETAVDIAAKRGELMDATAARVSGGMTAVISTRKTALQSLAQKFPNAQIVLANDNAPNQLVFSGEIAALEQFAALVASEKLGQCRRLAVAGPWHSPLMAQARLEFSSWLETIEFHPPKVPLVFNVTAATETDPPEIRRLIARNLVEPVCWRTAMESLRGTEKLALFEVGPGRVLSGLARANGFGGETRICNINNLRGVEMAAR